MTDDARRRADAAMPRIEQKLDDHIVRFDETKVQLSQWQQAHEEWCKNEISRLEQEINPIKKAFIVMETPVRWVGWTITSIATGACIWIGQKVLAFLARHWQ